MKYCQRSHLATTVVKEMRPFIENSFSFCIELNTTYVLQPIGKSTQLQRPSLFQQHDSTRELKTP